MWIAVIAGFAAAEPSQANLRTERAGPPLSNALVERQAYLGIERRVEVPVHCVAAAAARPGNRQGSASREPGRQARRRRQEHLKTISELFARACNPIPAAGQQLRVADCTTAAFHRDVRQHQSDGDAVRGAVTGGQWLAQAWAAPTSVLVAAPAKCDQPA